MIVISQIQRLFVNVSQPVELLPPRPRSPRHDPADAAAEPLEEEHEDEQRDGATPDDLVGAA